jgi:Subtilisin inhibitor-like
MILVALVSGCSDTTTGTPTPRSTSVSQNPTVAPEATELTIMVDDGAGVKSHWTLTCDPPGGTHPDPAAACRALQANGAKALPPVRKDVACTEVYGGAQTASVAGTWQGQRVRSSFSRVNGCEISRWDLLRGLLPPGGI